VRKKGAKSDENNQGRRSSTPRFQFWRTECREILSRISAAGVDVLIAGFLCTVPATSKNPARAGTQTAAEAHSVSGKVTAVGKSSFTLSVSSAKITSGSTTEESAGAKSMTFQVDSNTAIDGNLQVGADADVTYLIDSGQYIAISVRVGQ
jgi:hypothetical protein